MHGGGIGRGLDGEGEDILGVRGVGAGDVFGEVGDAVAVGVVGGTVSGGVVGEAEAIGGPDPTAEWIGQPVTQGVGAAGGVDVDDGPGRELHDEVGGDDGASGRVGDAYIEVAAESDGAGRVVVELAAAVVGNADDEVVILAGGGQEVARQDAAALAPDFDHMVLGVGPSIGVEEQAVEGDGGHGEACGRPGGLGGGQREQEHREEAGQRTTCDDGERVHQFAEWE